MSNKMLIDATHPEETRVVVLRGNRVEEFDFEAADRQQLRGNIYLAKVTRVEPSLQAAFIDYGGNRHGFLAFSEIHPDYYQIPFADRQALLQEQAKEAAEAAREEDESDYEEQQSSSGADVAANPERETITEVMEPGENLDSESDGPEEEKDEAVESVGAEDALEELPERRKPRPRQYKIQEVIKRRQVMLVQVVKEERGNKGAALTSYLSLAGRYSVLMPNTARGGGISRKITSPADRKRLKAIASELEVPEGMGVILRTAGANRTKSEVKRDFEYLLRLWENVRELTLRSTAPTLVYEEGSLIKRAIRDLYSREIDQVVVAGEAAYREAKEFMRMLMPSHARHVQLYRDETPVFSRNNVEAQLDAMFSPQVTLKSGGYIVINQTEALVSIDVNSGRATREHSIEDTALNTNLEASEEIARQLRLRDLAGLIVIDFIDMEEKRNNRAVERKLKDCLRADRARIQVGRISHFGLMEMSRQRIRTGVLESSTVSCPHCRGTGQVRSISSLSLQLLRALEDHLLRHSGHHLLVRTRPEVALYVLNQKRKHLAQLEERFGLAIAISGEAPESGAGFSVERGEPVTEQLERSGGEVIAFVEAPELPEPIEDEEDAKEAGAEKAEGAGASGGRDRHRRRRRRRGNGEDRLDRPRGGVEEMDGKQAPDDTVEVEAVETGGGETAEAESESERDKRRRRRGRRGGKRRGRGRENGDSAAETTSFDSNAGERGEGSEDERSESDADENEAPAPAVLSEGPGPVEDSPLPIGDGHAEEIEALTGSARPEPDERRNEPQAELEAAEATPPGAPSPGAEPEEDDRPKRTGWWSRKSSFF